MNARLKAELAEYRRLHAALVKSMARIQSLVDFQAGDGGHLPPEVVRIIDLICSRFGVSMAALLARGRTAHLARARLVAMALCLEYTGRTSVAIGGFFQRDHGTVLYARRVVAELESTEPAFALELGYMRSVLSSEVATRAA